VPLLGDLDRPATLGRLAHVADAVLHLAPPPSQGVHDPRTLQLLRALARGGVRRLVYASTSGVYGDCQGAWVRESRPLAPLTDRARRRVDAEFTVRAYARTLRVHATVLRVPGIYALDRVGGDPRERVQRGTPALVAAEDVYTNHIHADDLARACVAALMHGPTLRTIHVNDDSALPLGDHLDRVADASGLPRVPRVTREQAAQHFSAAQRSFLNESRRLDNSRMKRELRLTLRYPSVESALRGAPAPEPQLTRPERA
jgi:nucleoside-diphosphate-sugar epimerase